MTDILSVARERVLGGADGDPRYSGWHPRGINAMIVGNYLTTLGRSAQEDLDLLAELKMPVKELSKTL
jgi:hypothetical protein